MKLLTIFLVLASSRGFCADQKPVLGDLAIKNGVGCYYIEMKNGERPIMFGDYGSSGSAKIDGKQSDLELMFSNAMIAKKQGDDVTEKYQSGKYALDYHGKLIRSCSEEGAPCDASKGILALKYGHNQEAHQVTQRCGKFANSAKSTSK